MGEVTIYVYSKDPRYEKGIEVNKQLDDDEFYLFKEVWQLDDAGNYQNKIDSDFVKVVRAKWLA